MCICVYLFNKVALCTQHSICLIRKSQNESLDDARSSAAFAAGSPSAKLRKKALVAESGVSTFSASVCHATCQMMLHDHMHRRLLLTSTMHKCHDWQVILLSSQRLGESCATLRIVTLVHHLPKECGTIEWDSKLQTASKLAIGIQATGASGRSLTALQLFEQEKQLGPPLDSRQLEPPLNSVELKSLVCSQRGSLHRQLQHRTLLVLYNSTSKPN